MFVGAFILDVLIIPESLLTVFGSTSINPTTILMAVVVGLISIIEGTESFRSNGQFAVRGVILDNLQNIPTRNAVTQYDNAYEAATSEPDDCVARFQIRLQKKLGFGISAILASSTAP